MPRAAYLSLLVLLLWAHPALAEVFVLVGSWASGDVRRYRQDGTLVDTFIARGSGGLGFPDGLAYGADGNLYVSDAANAKVLKFNGSTGAFMSVFATTNITRAGFCAFGPEGDLYVCSNGDNRVHRFNPVTGAYIDAFATAPGLSYPAGLSWNAGVLYVSGFGSNTIATFDAATGAFQGNLPGSFVSPLYTRIDSSGRLNVCEYGANRLAQVSLPGGGVAGTYTSTNLKGPVGQLVLPDGTLLVTSWNNGRVLKYNESTGAYLGEFSKGYPQGNDIVLTPDIVPSSGAASLVALAVGCAGGRRRRRI